MQIQYKSFPAPQDIKTKRPGHIKRTGLYTAIIAEKMGMDEQFRELILQGI